MTFKKISKKASIGRKVLKDQGVIGLTIRSLQYLDKKTKKKGSKSNKKQVIYVKAPYNELMDTDFYNRKRTYKGSSKPKLTFIWLMPPPGRGSGGHINIFRFIKYLEDAGHTCKIYLCLEGGSGDVSHIWADMDGYPKVMATMEWYDSKVHMTPANGIFATSWETAYTSYNIPSDAKRFYFVQDFEPYFYPIGSLYTFAENTYKLGFFGITAGGWLSAKLSRDYGMKTEHYNFGADEDLYSYSNNKVRKEVFFYARPYTERRGFEMGVMALELFHKLHPDYIINMAGWDVSNYKINFPYVNLKTLDLDQLNNVYNKCVVGLIMSFTNMSLLPLEVMASGMIPVVNDGENNSLVSNNKYISYAHPDPVSLANAMSRVVNMKNMKQYSKDASSSVMHTTWDDAGKKFVEVILNEMRNNV